jgi:hypothetical protein
MQEEDERCCGTGTCIVDAQGLCWCGQQWNGQSMCRPAQSPAETTPASTSAAVEQQADSE